MGAREWRDVDMRPCPPGWQAVYFLEDSAGALAAWCAWRRRSEATT